MLKGHKLQERIGRIFKDINCLSNVFALRLNPEYKRSVKVYTSAQPCDYLIRTASQVIFFDTKECMLPIWYLSHARPGQIEGMEKLTRLGCTCGFLIWFYVHDYPNLRWLAPIAGRFPKKVTWEELPVWDWQRVLEERKAL